MNKVFLENQQITLLPVDLLGEGGEAEVYSHGKGAIKIYKEEKHPSFAGDPSLQKAAVVRLREVQTKLPAFPSGLPPSVVTPQKLCYDGKAPNKRITGYLMPLIPQAISLRDLATRDFRERSGITQEQVVAVMKDLHETVKRVHDSSVVIGDFNPFNVLVSAMKAFLIDADSMQFGAFEATAFTPRYVDPLICQPGLKIQKKVKSHTILTDWYAFAMLFFEVLMYTHPYYGVHKPKNRAERCGIDEMPLRRISVFHPDVKYPCAGIPLDTLPDTVLDWYRDLIENDNREEFPLRFLTDIRFDQKAAYLATATNDSIVSHVSNGTASSSKIFQLSPPGVILQVAEQGGKLYYLYHKDGKYFREDGSVVLAESLNQNLRFKIHEAESLIAKTGNKKVISLPGRNSTTADLYRGHAPVFDTNGKKMVHVAGGKLWLTQNGKTTQIDEAVENQTRLFAGESFGFGYYLAGEYRRAFVFSMDDKSTGKTSVDISVINGQIIDLQCYFSKERLWLITTVNDKGRLVNRATLIKADGQLLARMEDMDGADSWLGRIQGKSARAFGKLETLVCATDSGIQLVTQNGTNLEVAKEFAGTKDLVDASDNVIAGEKGLYVWNGREIRLIKTRN